MTEENKKRAVEMFRMYLDGYTYQEIADKYGISKQRVNLILNPKKNKLESKYERVIYKGLKKWLIENNYKLIDLQKYLSGKEQRQIYTYTQRKLSGETDFKISEIIKLINLTGMTFEQLFMQE